MGWLVAIAAIVFLASGAALAYVIGAASVLAYLVTDQGRFLSILPQRIFAQLDLFALMAMPLFILTGELMNKGGITRALIEFAMAIFGRFRGGLGHVNIATSVFFAGISGAATADAAALSNTLVPAMKEKGYDATYAAAITAASSIIGPIIPPSIILIIYGALMETSVAALFAAGIIPGLLLAGSLILLNTWLARRHDHPGGRGEELPGFAESFVRAAPALLLPFIILGGIVFGVVTPTEAAGIAVFAAAVVARIYNGMDFRTFFVALGQTAKLTGAVFMVLSAVACFGYLAGLMQWPQQLAQFVEHAQLGSVGYLLALNVILLIAGMIMEIPVALTLLVPLLAPVALAQGIDPTHLGIIICFNLCIGLVTPPLGACLITVSTVTGVNYWRLARAILPFVAVEVLVLIILIYVPQLSLFLPELAGLSTGGGN